VELCESAGICLQVGMMTCLQGFVDISVEHVHVKAARVCNFIAFCLFYFSSFNGPINGRGDPFH
jgi:hypothetical protein